MAYIVAADLRSATLAEYAAGLALDTTEVASTGSEALLTATIARVSHQVDDWTRDHFETESLTLELDGNGSSRLMLPKRCTAVSTVKLRDATGTLGSAQTATVYRLRSSLFSSGSQQIGELDYLDTVPLGAGLAGSTAGAYGWPCGPQTVQVVGSFGWTTTPAEIKRVVALLVYDHYKPARADLRRATRWTDGTAEYSADESTPTGIQQADEIIEEFTRKDTPPRVG